MFYFIISLFISNFSHASSFEAYSVCDQIKQYNYEYTRNHCVRIVESTDSFDQNAVVLCESMAIKGQSQAAINCLNVIKNKIYNWKDIINCQFQADRGWSQSALECLKKVHR